MADKPRDLAVYWETLATDDGEAYYYNESTNVTTYDDPAAPRSSTAIRLPPKWAAFVADDGEPYFFNEERSETSWDVPAGSVFGAASPAAPAGGGSAKVAPGGGGGGLSRAPLSKVDDTRVYWQTFTDSDGAPYYFQEDAGTTTYEEPTEPVVVKGGARVFPILLPPGWLAAADASGEVYFADEQDNTAWDLPAAARSTEPAAAAPVGQGGAIHGGAAAPRPARRAATQAQRDAARALLTVNVVAWLARKRAGDAKAFRHRTLLFRKKADDTYLTVNPLERETVVRLLKDRAYEKVGALNAADTAAHGFDGSADAVAAGDASDAPLSLWNCAVDKASGKAYYINLETKATAWLLPPGGRVVSRVVPKAAELVSRVTGVVAAVAAASARRRALAAAGHVKPGGRPPSLEGFLYKSDHRGRNFKWRWLVADGPAAELVWYHSDPAATLAKHGVTEEVTGRLGVSGAAVVSGLTSASAAAADALPAPHALTVTVAGRKLVLCAKDEATANEWVAYLCAAAAGEIAAASGSSRRPKGGEGEDRDELDEPEHVPPAPGFLIRQEGSLQVTAPGRDGRTTARMYVVLDPDSRLLLVFSDASRAPGTERAVVDMLSASVSVEPPPGGPPLEDPAAAPRAVYVSVDDAGIYGGAPGVGAGSSRAAAAASTGYTATVLLAPSAAERDVWLACLAAACDPTTVVQLQDETKAVAAATSPLLAPTLLHVQLKAGLLAALGSPAERRVALDANEKLLTIFADARGAKVARALKLTAPGVRIDFACDAGAVAPGWSRLRIDVTAPEVSDRRTEPVPQTHVLRTRGYEAYVAWASAMAAL